MTITSPKIIATMLHNKGAYPGDPPADAIYKFHSPEGRTAFAVFFSSNSGLADTLSPEEYAGWDNSPYVKNPVLLFHKERLTKEGKVFLEEQKMERSAPVEIN